MAIPSTDPMDLAIGPMPERRDVAPASARLSERSVLQLGIGLAAGFVILSLVTGVVPLGPLHGWVAIHLALAGATTVAIGTFMPHFGVTLAGTRPEPVAARLGGVLSLATGMALVALGRPLLGDHLAAGGGALVLVGLGITAWNTYAPMRSGLTRRHPIVQLTYGVALADLVVGATLATLFLLGFAPVTGAWVALKPAHAWLNVFGFVSLTIAGTLIYLYPTMLGTRIRPHWTMAMAVVGLLLGPPLVAVGSAIDSQPAAVVGGGLALAGAAGLLGYGIEIWSRRGRWANDLAWHSLTARHGLAGMAWFLVTVTTAMVGLVRDGAAVPGWTLGAMAVPLIGGWALQELVAAWGHLLPAVGPADKAAKARQRDVLSRLALPRVLAWNLGVALAWAGLGLGIPVAIGLGAVLLGGAVVTALVLLAMALLIGRTRASVQP
jgi:nitrite reductase (NO-forming)